MNYYEHHLGDYAKDTRHLTMLEHGAYRLLLDVYYSTEGPIPAELKAVQRLAGAKSSSEREAVKSVLTEFFELTDSGWTHSKCEKVILAYREKSEKASKSANARWDKSKRNANALRAQCEGNAPKPSNQTPIDADATRKAELDQLTDRLIDAAGQSIDPSRHSFADISRPLAWLADGCDLDLDILPAVRRIAARASPMQFNGWKYFDGAVADAKANRLKPMPEGRTDERTHHKTRDATVRDNHFAGILQAVAGARGT